MPRPEKIEESELPEEGETPYYFHLPQRCINRGKNAMHDAWTTWLASDEAVEIVARKMYEEHRTEFLIPQNRIDEGIMEMYFKEARELLSALVKEV